MYRHIFDIFSDYYYFHDFINMDLKRLRHFLSRNADTDFYLTDEHIAFESGTEEIKFSLPDITFSSLKKTTTYGKYTWADVLEKNDEVRKLLEEVMRFEQYYKYINAVQRLSGILSETESFDDLEKYEISTDDLITEVEKYKKILLSEIDDETSYEYPIMIFIKAANELVYRIKTLKSKSILLGTFVAGATARSPNTITLYVNQIKALARRDRVSVSNLFSSIAIHEAFHAFHYFKFCAEKSHNSDFQKKGKPDKKKIYECWTGKQSSKEKASTVKETLATCCEYEWCTDVLNDRALAHMVLDKLKGKYFPSYPYAGAKKYLKLDSCFKRSCDDLFSASIDSWEHAYDILESFQYA